MTAERRPFLIWLLIITAVGCVLRIYHFTAIPFNYDELSALNRTHFNSFSQLIQYGVAVDGHPAGVQVFLYYWTHLFGDKEWVIKLPFILMGIACIPLIYLIGATWFNRNTGLLAACFMACLQYTVMFSQVARPYISGVFFILLATVIWNRVMKEVTWVNIAALAITLALCAYNHYFSLLTAACIAATGLFIIERKYLLRYTLALLFSIVLFLPHIPLFLAQLKLSGLQWLSVPTPAFFKNYLYYVLNFSNYIIAVIVLLLIQGIYLTVKYKLPVSFKYKLIALLWFVIPAAIGYLYSVYRAPVLHNLVLIFGFPFLVLFVCSFISLSDSYIGDIEIGVLLTVLVFSLVVERSYYKFFYHQETEMFARHISGYEAAYGNNKVAAVANTNPAYLAYYKKKYNTNWSYTTFNSIGGNSAWRTWLQKCNAQYLILCNPPQEWSNEYLPISLEYFHCIDSIYSGFTTDIYILKRDSSSCKPVPAPLFTYVLGDSTGVRVRYKIKPVVDGGQEVYSVCDTSQFGLFFSYLGPAMGITSEEVKINVSAEVYNDSLKPNGYLRLQFIGHNGHLKQERKSAEPDGVDSTNKWHKVYLTARLYHAPLQDAQFVAIDLLSSHQSCLKFKNFKVEAVPDNPFLYTLIKR